jgi:hypothetical protein
VLLNAAVEDFEAIAGHAGARIVERNSASLDEIFFARTATVTRAKE